MPTTVLSPAEVTLPFVVTAPAVYIKRLWSDTWSYRPDLELVRAIAAASGQDLGSCELRRRYGLIKQPWELDVTVYEPIDLSGYWVKVSLVGDQGEQQQWVGRISNDTREISGTTTTLSGSQVRSGEQTWVAYEPLHILQRIHISRSIWKVGDNEKELGWVPDLNARDANNMIVGNRSASKSEGGGNTTYVYGGTDLWTHYDYAEYILKRFVDENSIGGPIWSLGGQADLLANITDTIRFSTTQTVADLLRQLIPIRLGLDYTIRATETGFEVHVFALSSQEWSFGGVTLARNPNAVNIVSSKAIDVPQCRVVRTADHVYDRIRVLGRRVVVCCSLRASDGSLVPKWSSALETAYKAGTGNPTDAGDDHDAARQAETYRPVYQSYGAPIDWNFNNGTAAPIINSSGQTANGVADYQNQIRSTLSYLPLREGYDYSTDPPTDHNLSGHESDFWPPAVWLFDPDPEEGEGRYVLAEEADIGVSVSRTDWGVFLSPSPNHLLALNHWASSIATDTDPKYDYATMVATIAVESDQRFGLEVAVAGGGTPSGGVLEIEVPDAELWYLAPNTVVGTDVTGALKTSGVTGRVLRNDVTRLGLVMAGALARYNALRGRAEITIKGLLPWGELVGQVMAVVEDGGDTQMIDAPITAVEWVTGNDPTTIIRTGFAQ